MDRKLSARTRSLSNKDEKPAQNAAEPIIESEANENEDDAEREEGGESKEITEIDFEKSCRRICGEVDQFLCTLKDAPDPPEQPECVEKLASLVEAEIGKIEAERDPGKWCPDSGEECPFLDAVEKVSRLAAELAALEPGSTLSGALDRASGLLHRAMVFLEDEFRSLLEDSKTVVEADPAEAVTTPAAPAAAKTKKQSSFVLNQEHDRGSASEPDSARKGDAITYAPETLTRLSKIAAAMIAAGYAPECCQAYSLVRRYTLEERLTKMGLEKMSIEDVQKMTWEQLEGEITTWTKACKRCIAVYFPNEEKLCDAVFPGSPEMRPVFFGGVTRGIVIQLLNFAEAVLMTKRSVEKLFKYLDMNEALRDLFPRLEMIFSEETRPDAKTETEKLRFRLGEAAVGSFSDLENSIRADTGKTTVPGGAVHPLTRYVMNYLKYACSEYKDTIEQVFQEHKKGEHADEPAEGSAANAPAPPSPFVVQLTGIMDLLDSTLESKSKLYKDQPLSYIFLMNNGRYIMQKIKESSEMHSLLGDNRKRSSELRQYHKNYTRETWGKLLGCLKHEGLMQGKGSINKPALKERFKSFNALFDEIHKTQSGWVVSDEQLQSELRVSISAVVVPAYRSFLGRFQQYLDPGRQTEKYIKFGPEELETFIDDLFDGNPAATTMRRR